MNSALRQYNALFIIPTLQALWLIFAILGGGIYYQEYLSMSWHEITMFLVGLFILLCGVAALPRATIEMKRMEDDEGLFFLIHFYLFLMLSNTFFRTCSSHSKSYCK